MRCEGGHLSDLGGSPGPFGSPVLSLVGVSSKDEPGAERRHLGEIRGWRLLQDNKQFMSRTFSSIMSEGTRFPQEPSISSSAD